MFPDYVHVLMSAIVSGFLSWFPVYTSDVVDKLGLRFCPLCTYAGVLLAILYFFRFEMGEVIPRILRKKVTDEHSFLFYVILFTLVVGLPIVGRGKEISWSPYVLMILGILITLFSWKQPLSSVLKPMRGDGSLTPCDGILTGIGQAMAFFGIPSVALVYAVLELIGIERERALRLMLISSAVYFAIALVVSSPTCNLPAMRALYSVGSFVGAFFAMYTLTWLSKRPWFPILYGLIGIAGGLSVVIGS